MRKSSEGRLRRPERAPEVRNPLRVPDLNDAALNLAVFRIVVGILLLTTREVQAAADWASLAPALAVAPPGWGWALALVPASAPLAVAARIVVVAGAVLGVVGCFARPAFACATLAALYLLALPLRSGMPFHYHHLVWFAALCAASPCADALSVARWRRARRGEAPPARSPAYGVPIRMAWLLLGAVFFFPGLWKLRASGLAWITSDNLRNQLYWKWAVTPGLHPPFRVDRFPWALHLAAGCVILLELTFAFAVWWRWTRAAAVGAALLFHLFAWLFMGIDFSGLWLTYVVFVDWEALLRRLRRSPPETARPPARAGPGFSLARAAPALLVGVGLWAGAVEAGLRGRTAGWPFACYPTFQDLAGTDMPALAVALVASSGDERLLDEGALADPADQQRERVFGLGLIAAARGADAPARFAAYWARLARRPALRAAGSAARAVRFYAGQMSTLPSESARPPRGRQLLYELPL
jgi:hypothetical protein